MKAKIDFFGDLWLYRANGWKKQWCPYTGMVSRCGFNCPKFSYTYTKGALHPGSNPSLNICGQIIPLDSLEIDSNVKDEE